MSRLTDAEREALNVAIDEAETCRCCGNDYGTKHVYAAVARIVAQHEAAERERWVTAVTNFADERGVNVGDEDSEWWQGYRQAQRECWYDAQALRALVAQQHDGGGSDG